MKSLSFLLSLAIAGSLHCFAQSPKETAAAPTKEEQAVLDLSKAKWAWMADKDVVKLDALFDEKAMFVHMSGKWGKERELDVIKSGRIWYLSLAAVVVETIYATWPHIPGIQPLTRVLSYLVYLVPFYTDERQLWPFLAASFRDALIGGGLPALLANALVPPANPFVPQATLPTTFGGFNNPIGLDVRRAIDLEQLLVLGAGGLGERLLGHVKAVGLAAGYHQQRLIDELDLVGGVPTHQVQQATHRVFEGRAGVRVGLPVVVITLPVEIERQLRDLLIGQVGVAGI